MSESFRDPRPFSTYWACPAYHALCHRAAVRGHWPTQEEAERFYSIYWKQRQ